ncbi:MAG: hypothetical protein ACJA0N_000985 [Pseudohongiellaceae bacterium]|jgi:hypothetical protein
MNDNTEDSNRPPQPKKLIIESAGITPEQQIANSAATDKYSQYDPLVQSKEHYEDALFSSEDALDQAITQGFNSEDGTKKKHEESKVASNDENESPPSAKAKPIILRQFLTTYSQEQKFKSGVHLFSKDATHLPLIQRISIDGLYTENEASNPHYEEYSCKLPKAQCGELPQGKTTFKTHFQAAIILTQYQLQKVKVAFEVYVGKSLPARKVDFDYKPLKLKSKKERGNLYSNYDIDSLFKTKGIKPHQLLLESNQELNKLIKCQLSNNHKTALLERYIQYLLPVYHQLFITYGKRAVSARNPQHGEIAELCKSTVKSIVTLYKQLYMTLYQATPLLYGPQRSKANTFAYQLFDWLMFEQLIGIATQTPLPDLSIKLTNKLFYALAQSEPQEIIKTRRSICSDETTNIERQFIDYQTLNIIDFKNINTKLHQPIINIIKELNLHSRVIDLYADHPEVSGFWADLENGKCLQNKKPNSGIKIDISHLLTSIDSLYQQSVQTLGNQEGQHKVFSELHALIQSLHNWLTQIKSNHYSMYQTGKFALFSSLENCFNQCAHTYAINVKQTQAKAPVIDLPEKPTASKTGILVAENNDILASLQFSESKAKINLNIGSPVICQETNTEDNSSTTYLGICQRIVRNQTGLVDIELSKLSNEYTSVIITSVTPPHNKGLLYSKGNKHFLIADAEEENWKGRTLDIEMHDQSTHVICIKGLVKDYGGIRIYGLF